MRHIVVNFIIMLSHLVITRGFLSTFKPSIRLLRVFSSLPEPSLINHSQEVPKAGESIVVNLKRFGYLGVSVDVVGTYFSGLILQKEISYYEDKIGRALVVGDELPAFVEQLTEDGKLHISFRPRAKDRTFELKKAVMDRLLDSPSGSIMIGVSVD